MPRGTSLLLQTPNKLWTENQQRVTTKLSVPGVEGTRQANKLMLTAARFGQAWMGWDEISNEGNDKIRRDWTLEQPGTDVQHRYRCLGPVQYLPSLVIMGSPSDSSPLLAQCLQTKRTIAVSCDWVLRLHRARRDRSIRITRSLQIPAPSARRVRPRASSTRRSACCTLRCSRCRLRAAAAAAAAGLGLVPVPPCACNHGSNAPNRPASVARLTIGTPKGLSLPPVPAAVCHAGFPRVAVVLCTKSIC